MIFNIKQLTQALTKEAGGNSYSYVKITNLISGIKGAATDNEIDKVVKVIERESAALVKSLKQLKTK